MGAFVNLFLEQLLSVFSLFARKLFSCRFSQVVTCLHRIFAHECENVNCWLNVSLYVRFASKILI